MPRKRGLDKFGISPWQAVNILVENCAMGGTYAGLGKERGEAGGIGVFHGWANGLLTEAVDSVVDILWGKLPMPEPPPAGENCTLFEQKAPELLGCRKVSTNRRGKKATMEAPCGSLLPVDSENRFSTVDNRNVGRITIRGYSPYVWFASLHRAFHSTPLRVVRGGASRW